MGVPEADVTVAVKVTDSPVEEGFTEDETDVAVTASGRK